MSEHHRSGGWTSTDLRKWKPRIAATLPAPCTVCGRTVAEEMAWQVDHIVPLSLGGDSSSANLGPAHRTCNARAGGRLGAAKTNAAKKTARRLPNW